MIKMQIYWKNLKRQLQLLRITKKLILDLVLLMLWLTHKNFFDDARKAMPKGKKVSKNVDMREKNPHLNNLPKEVCLHLTNT